MPILTRQPEADEPAMLRSDHRGDRALHRTAPTWAEAAFQRRVEVFRRQLAPVCSRAGLAASYGREAGHRAVDGRSRAVRSITPLQVAYALRWMELARPAPALVTWADLLD